MCGFAHNQGHDDKESYTCFKLLCSNIDAQFPRNCIYKRRETTIERSLNSITIGHVHKHQDNDGLRPRLHKLCHNMWHALPLKISTMHARHKIPTPQRHVCRVRSGGPEAPGPAGIRMSARRAHGAIYGGQTDR